MQKKTFPQRYYFAVFFEAGMTCFPKLCTYTEATLKGLDSFPSV